MEKGKGHGEGAKMRIQRQRLHQKLTVNSVGFLSEKTGENN